MLSGSSGDYSSILDLFIPHRSPNADPVLFGTAVLDDDL
jgi:hypothetical protein